MMKEKKYNPAQEARKAEKAKAIKKGKAEAASRRNEKLAKRNPDRLQQELDELKAIEQGGGKLTTHERKMLEQLEKDVKAVRKAREALGIKDSGRPFRPSGGAGGNGGRDAGGYNALGKRRRDAEESEESDVPDDVKRIPMPRDTPPPIPKDVMDRWWAKRRARGQGGPPHQNQNQNERHRDRNENKTQQPPVEAKTVYEAKPQIRDLRKEATSARFMPAAVREKMDRLKGAQGSKLLEPEEADRLEKEGYVSRAPASSAPGKQGEAKTEDDERLERELAEFSRNVEMEEVEDEDA